MMARFNLGGPAQQISSLMSHLDPEVFEQKLIVGLCAQDEVDYSEIRQLEFPIEKNKYLGRKISLFSDLFALLLIIKSYYKYKPDIVHSHTTKAGVICRVARLFYFRKLFLVHTYHGHLLYGYFNDFQTKLVVLLERTLGLFSSKLVTVGYRVKQELVEKSVAPWDKFVVIPPGICFLDQNKGTNPNVNDSPPLSIGFVGRVTGIKRPDRFLKIVETVRSLKLKIHFVVAGDGKLLNEMKEYAIRRNLDLDFLGWVSDIEPLFDKLDILVLTSDNEGTPISIVQGAAHSCIALSTDVGSVEDVLLDGETGFICRTDEEFAQKIEYLYENRTILNAMKQKAKSIALEKFSGSRLAQDHAKLYTEIMSS